MTAFHRTAEWAALTRKLRPMLAAQVAAGTAVCVDCGGPVLPGERWQCGHRLDQHTHPEFRLADWNIGPSHSGKGRACNQRAGAQLGNRIRHRNQARRVGMIQWRAS